MNGSFDSFSKKVRQDFLALFFTARFFRKAEAFVLWGWGLSPAVSFTKESIEGNLPRPLIDPSNMRLSPTSGSHSSQSSLYDFFGAERCKTVPYACNQSERHCILPTTLVGFERSITPCGMSFCRAGALLPCKGVPSRILHKGEH